MLSPILVEVERVAAARWAATEPSLSRRAERQAALLEQANQVVARCWTAEPAAITPPVAAGPRLYRLFDANGHTLACSYCGRNDHWMVATDDQQRVRLFVCEHRTLPVNGDVIHHVTTVSLGRVARCESVPPTRADEE